jgi:uncharacterized membrane protein YhhN
MIFPVIFVLAAALLLVLLVYEKQEKEKPRLIAKTILSCLFVLVAFLQPSSVPFYGKFILLGLISCLAGDVCLALPGDKIFRAGLVAFLAGHIFYVVGFTDLVPVHHWLIPGAILFWVFSVLVFMWLRPHLKAMLIPVVVYIMVITVLISGAWAVFDKSASPFLGRTFVFAGAFLFYVSDVFVARNQFVRQQFLNRLVGLPLYYFGQFLLAFSIGLL